MWQRQAVSSFPLELEQVLFSRSFQWDFSLDALSYTSWQQFTLLLSFNDELTIGALLPYLDGWIPQTIGRRRILQ
jgi:hypothetical protein